ncbi:glycosyltransferase [Pararoseomonas indoligenes]|uniref:Glycosyltransferase n=1 Tax=Roseomonas indoligenes TaxID=2820811 RepID=A0A940N445_9PROT|nr:glycosyltransferase [Pararoseomonas indoligenes]MBP0496239.1 glycosyltransferase [Pararoseomonas indoligenes]
MRVALVSDPLTVHGGAERVIEQMLSLFPQADVFAIVDIVPPAQRGFLGDRPVTTSFIQRIPGGARRYQSLFPLWPLAVEQFDLTAYDLVLSSHHGVAYGVLTRPGQVHVSYVHSPMRYAWDQQHAYLREAGLERGAKSWLARWALHKARLWDFAAAQRPDILVANSQFVAGRIRTAHRREATVIHPPVATRALASWARTDQGPPGGYYLSVGRLVPYKRTELLARAFAQMPDLRLKIVGDGPDAKRIAALAAPNVELLGRVPTEEVHRLMAGADALVYAGIEDFGIAAVEAQATGTPVVAYRAGGMAEIIVGSGSPGTTGGFIESQTEDGIIAAVRAFEEARRPRASDCIANAARFSEERFRESFAGVVERALASKGQPEVPIGREQPAAWPPELAAAE